MCKPFKDSARLQEELKSLSAKEIEQLMTFFLSFLKFIYLSNLYTQRGAGTHDPEIKSHMLFPPSQPGIHLRWLLNWDENNYICSKLKQTNKENNSKFLSCQILLHRNWTAALVIVITTIIIIIIIIIIITICWKYDY